MTMAATTLLLASKELKLKFFHELLNVRLKWERILKYNSVQFWDFPDTYATALVM